MRERVPQWHSAERSEGNHRRDRTPTVPAMVLGLQRSAGNAATARLLQRAAWHTQYAPAVGGAAIAPEFRRNHIGQDWQDAIKQHATRGTYGTNTFVKMTDDEAGTEIYGYLDALPAHEDISTWDSLAFETYSPYLCFETTLLDNDAAHYQVRRVWATVDITAWWKNRPGVFMLGHMGGIATVDPEAPDETWEVWMEQSEEMEGVEEMEGAV